MPTVDSLEAILVVSWALAWTGLLYGFAGRAVEKRRYPRFDPRAHPEMPRWHSGAAMSQQWRQDWIVRTAPRLLRVGWIALVVAVVTTVLEILR